MVEDVISAYLVGFAQMGEDQAALEVDERHPFFKPDPRALLHNKYYTWLHIMLHSVQRQQEQIKCFGHHLAEQSTTSQELQELTHVLTMQSDGQCSPTQARARSTLW